MYELVLTFKEIMRKIKLLAFILVLFSTSCKSAKDLPNIEKYNSNVGNRIEVEKEFYTLGSNKLRKNKQGLWELYIEGDPLERGLANGKLTKELIFKQEKAFTNKIGDIVSSKFYLSILKLFVSYFNRQLYLNVDNEYKAEIYGISRFASDDFNNIAPKYTRMLNYHAAHDIGHALQDLALVGCTSFAAWGNMTDDGELIIGRNFDFYAGDEFSEEKIIAFVNPQKGQKFMMVTWAGMIGVVSGMNKKGLTITINAGSSDIPGKATTPISILAREILQYATTIEEAVKIAKSRKVFVSESILVGSAADKKAMLIEVSPNNIDFYEVNNTNYLICSNHFQSNAYANDENNLKRIEESHSQYRFEKMTELLETPSKLTPQKAVDILRNKEGLNNVKIGYGNEKAINQLLAHHGIVFKPESLQVWVSSNPYQLGEFVAYDLNTVFDEFKTLKENKPITKTEMNIAKDPFLLSNDYKKYEEYRIVKKEIELKTKQKERINKEILDHFETLNPNYWETYYTLGEYFFNKKYYTRAKILFEKALTKEVTTIPDIKNIKEKIKLCNRKIN